MHMRGVDVMLAFSVMRRKNVPCAIIRQKYLEPQMPFRAVFMRGWCRPACMDDLVGKGCHRSAKPARGEDLDVEEFCRRTARSAIERAEIGNS